MQILDVKDVVWGDLDVVCGYLVVVWGVSTDPERSRIVSFHKKYFLSRLIFFYRIIIIIITQPKSRTTCPVSEFVFRFFIFIIQSYPALQMVTCWICVSKHNNKVFLNTYNHETSHQGYMSVPVA